MVTKARMKLSPELSEEILRLSPANVTLGWLRTNLAATGKGPPRIDVAAEMTFSKKSVTEAGCPTPNLTPAWSSNIKNNACITTVGRYITSLVLFGINPAFRAAVNHIDVQLNGEKIDLLGSELANLLLEEKITSEDYIMYIDRLFWFSYASSGFMVPSYDLPSIMPIPAVIRRRDELLKQNAGKLNAATVQKIEMELVKLAKTELSKTEPGGMDLFDSGARGKFGIQYKNTSIMRGMIPRSDNHSELNLSVTNQIEGTRKDETHLYADMVTTTAFSVSVGTQVGGYETKKMNAAFQSVVLGPPGSDCGTKQGYLATIENRQDFYLRYAMKKGGLVLLDSASMTEYMGKTVKLRSPMYCLTDMVCSKCAGEMYYRMGIENVGLVCNRLSSSILQASLKLKHDLSIKTTRIDMVKYTERV